MNRQMYLKIAQAVRRNPDHVERLLSYLSANRHLERIADHATNIAEDVIYMVRGKTIKHHVEEGREAQLKTCAGGE
jgi:phosphate transport system protein